MKTIISIFFAYVFASNIYAQNVQSIADSNNLFAFNLYAEVNKGNSGNLFFSPFSISTALAMTYAGARNETENQMRNTLHFNLEQVLFHSEYKSYLEKIESDTGKNLIIEVANSLWVSNNYNLLNPFTEIVKNDYNSGPKNVDFVNESEQVRQEINSWVEVKTNNKIQELIKQGMISGSTKMVLVNAIYFNGKWNKPFSKDSTRNEPFYISNGGNRDTIRAILMVIASFMHNTWHYNYYEDPVLQAIEIPYDAGQTSMLVLLPNEAEGMNIDDMESQLNDSYYSTIISGMRSQKVVLALPKFKITGGFEISSVLSNMGMPAAFTGSADFSGMSNEAVSVSAVVHKAFIDVSEEGTEAAAATAVMMRMTAAAPQKPKLFIANHPFIFIIRDNATGAVLFMGKINEPED